MVQDDILRVLDSLGSIDLEEVRPAMTPNWAWALEAMTREAAATATMVRIFFI